MFGKKKNSGQFMITFTTEANPPEVVINDVPDVVISDETVARVEAVRDRAVNLANEARHQRDKAVAELKFELEHGENEMAKVYPDDHLHDITDDQLARRHPFVEFDNDLASLPQLSVELWRFQDPSGFVFVDLNPSLDWYNAKELPLGSGRWHDPQTWAWYDRHPTGVLDVTQMGDRRGSLIEHGYRFVGWQDLPDIVRSYITMCLLPHSWEKALLARADDDAVLKRIQVWVKGDFS
jgi:hypothetical protein